MTELGEVESNNGSIKLVPNDKRISVHVHVCILDKL